MADHITVLNNLQNEITILPNRFIDEQMLRADGEYVKIYLMILRLQNAGQEVDAERIADRLELTRRDVVRAVNYWEKVGLLAKGAVPPAKATSTDAAARADSDSSMAWQAVTQAQPASAPPQAESVPKTQRATGEVSAGAAANAALLARPVPEKPNLQPTEMAARKDADLDQTLYMVHTYLGRPLSQTETNTFYYIRDTLHFSCDLMDYLIEYCVSKGKKSVRYMERVAIEWYQKEITTVAKAKEESALYTKNVFPVMKAFGISNRNPGPAELDFIKKWNELGLEIDIIVEACNRALLATHEASFPYANRILNDWKRLGVRTTADIRLLDERHRAAAAKATEKAATGSTPPKRTRSAPVNQFHNFDQGSYDYKAIEARLLEKNRR